MHVAFDAKRALWNGTGLGNYSRDVLRILATHRPGNRYVAYAAKAGGRALAAGVELRTPDTLFGRIAAPVWRTKGIVGQLVRDGAELFHGLSNELPLGLEHTRVRSVVTIHDLIFERYPELYRPVDRKIYRWKFKGAAERAGLVIAISEQTKRDLVDLYGIAPGRIRVVNPGCHAAFLREPAAEVVEATRRAHGVPDRFLLSVGTVETRKNLRLLVEALPGIPDLPVLVVGRRTAYADEVVTRARALGVESRIRFLESVSMEQLAVLYRLAVALVYPSIFEGFGLPIIEALFSGTPVVTSAGGVFAEVGGPGSAYVDPQDPKALAETLRPIVEDEGRRRAMRDAGFVWVQRFSDAHLAGALFAAYEEALR